MIGIVVKRVDFERMPVDDLWKLHLEISSALNQRIVAEKKVLERRLSQLQAKSRPERASSAPERRPYPRVLPKFRNPDDRSQTWAGRGKQPRWLTAQLRSGRRVDEFRI
jgi:DNA-binding protein H-NS